MPPGNSTTTININNQANLAGNNNDTLVGDPLLNNLLTGSLNKITLPPAISSATKPPTPLTLYFDPATRIDDLWMAITWGK